MIPLSKPSVEMVCKDIPECRSPLSMACSMGAGPRYRGRREGWTLIVDRPSRICSGINSPNDAAMTKSNGCFACSGSNSLMESLVTL